MRRHLPVLTDDGMVRTGLGGFGNKIVFAYPHSRPEHDIIFFFFFFSSAGEAQLVRAGVRR